MNLSVNGNSQVLFHASRNGPTLIDERSEKWHIRRGSDAGHRGGEKDLAVD